MLQPSLFNALILTFAPSHVIERTFNSLSLVKDKAVKINSASIVPDKDFFKK